MKETVRATLYNEHGQLVHFEDTRFNPETDSDETAIKGAIMRLISKVPPYTGDSIKITWEKLND